MFTIFTNHAMSVQEYIETVTGDYYVSGMDDDIDFLHEILNEYPEYDIVIFKFKDVNKMIDYHKKHPRVAFAAVDLVYLDNGRHELMWLNIPENAHCYRDDDGIEAGSFESENEPDTDSEESEPDSELSDRAKDMLFEVIEALRLQVKVRDDFKGLGWKDVDDYIFRQLSITVDELKNIYDGRNTPIYTDSAPKT